MVTISQYKQKQFTKLMDLEINTSKTKIMIFHKNLPEKITSKININGTTDAEYIRLHISGRRGEQSKKI